MPRYALYDPSSGRVVGTMECPQESLQPCLASHVGLSALEADSMDPNQAPGFMVVSETLTPRQPLSAVIDKTGISADGVDTATISGLPDPCTVLIDATAHDITGGVLEVTSNMPATYKVSIDHWPYLLWSTEITAQ